MRITNKKKRVLVVLIVIGVFLSVLTSAYLSVTFKESLDVHIAQFEKASMVSVSASGSNGPVPKGNSVKPWSLDSLLLMLGDRWYYWWIKKRIQKTWNEMEAAGLRLRGGHMCSNWTNLQRRKVMIIPGVLTLTNFARPDVIHRGGPLGELMQWADLIAACFALCNSLAVRYHVSGAANELFLELDDPSLSGLNHSTGCDSDYVDVIFTDIPALHQLPLVVRNAYRNRFRLADAFGTEPKYNDRYYIERHPEIAGKVGWGGLGLKPKQFFTLYPHTPDNSFLGFVVLNSTRKAKRVQTMKENYALVMGKEIRYIEEHIDALRIIHELIPLRFTINPSDRIRRILPAGVHFYGIVDSEEYQSIIAAAKVCVGLGHPVESPSALEALANGCVFLNPRLNLDATAGFHDKPTSRKVTSQVPYLEHHVGPPHVYTIDYRDVDQLHSLLISITNKRDPVFPFVPHEFTALGFVERLDAYLNYQEFCSRPSSLSEKPSDVVWPPTSALRVVHSQRGHSCSHACFSRGLVCEPVFFPIVNNISYFLRTGANHTRLQCQTVDYPSEPFVPAFKESDDPMTVTGCELQGRPELFSCAEKHPLNGIRICPCRDFDKYQIALCRDCISLPVNNDTNIVL